MERRTFIRSIAGAAAGAGLLSGFNVKSPAGNAAHGTVPIQDPSDERFWKVLRSQFPLTTDRIYLNTGGLGASPYPVIEMVQSKMDELERISETGHSAELWKEIKGRAAALMGCTVEERAFTRNTTEGINVVANGLPLGEGDEVVSTTQEHVANIVTWLELRKRKGIRIKLFEPSGHSAQENPIAIEEVRRILREHLRQNQ